MRRRILIAALALLAMVSLLAVGGGIWAYSNGHYHALRGGFAQDKDLDKAVFYFKIAYEKNPQAFMVAHDIACCYALKGDNESCFHWLRLALKSHYADYAKKYAKTEHDFDSVRQTAEFQSLIYDSPPK
jgi:tetratricopeptide (TPR) repeat protein